MGIERGAWREVQVVFTGPHLQYPPPQYLLRGFSREGCQYLGQEAVSRGPVVMGVDSYRNQSPRSQSFCNVAGAGPRRPQSASKKATTTRAHPSHKAIRFELSSRLVDNTMTKVMATGIFVGAVDQKALGTERWAPGCVLMAWSTIREAPEIWHAAGVIKAPSRQ